METNWTMNTKNGKTGYGIINEKSTSNDIEMQRNPENDNINKFQQKITIYCIKTTRKRENN